MLRYTTEDLLLYLYQETTPEETRLIKAALEADWELKEQLDILKNSMNMLDMMIESPRPQSVKSILNYAGVSTAVEQS